MTRIRTEGPRGLEGSALRCAAPLNRVHGMRAVSPLAPGRGDFSAGRARSVVPAIVAAAIVVATSVIVPTGVIVSTGPSAAAGAVVSTSVVVAGIPAGGAVVVCVVIRALRGSIAGVLGLHTRAGRHRGLWWLLGACLGRAAIVGHRGGYHDGFRQGHVVTALSEDRANTEAGGGHGDDDGHNESGLRHHETRMGSIPEPSMSGG
jgi:hypothetical protein